MDEPIRARARSTGPAYTHRIEMRDHELTVDEPPANGGADAGPTPHELLAAALAGCTAITVEMYARRKEWDIGQIEAECKYHAPERGHPTEFELILRLPRGLSPEQVDRLTTIAAKCPVHRTLQGEIRFNEHVELVDPPTS